MVRLLCHGHPFPSPAGPRAVPAAAQGGSAATPPAPTVHADEVEDDAEVAGEHRDDEKQQQGGVQLQVRGPAVPDEAPRPGAVLDVLPVAQQRQGAKEQRDRVDGGQHGQAASARHMALVEVGAPDGQVALQGHGEEHEHRGQAEEGHGEGEVGARAPLRLQCHQGLVPSVGSQHHGADEAGPEQVGEHQLCHQHVEQGDGVPASCAAARVPPPAARQQRQRDEVPQHPGREHRGADGRALAGGEPLPRLAVLRPRVIGDTAHGGGPRGETPSSPGSYLGGGESGSRSARGSRGEGGGTQVQSPLPAPRAPRPGSAPGLALLSEAPLGCSIRAALGAPLRVRAPAAARSPHPGGWGGGDGGQPPPLLHPRGDDQLRRGVPAPAGRPRGGRRVTPGAGTCESLSGDREERGPERLPGAALRAGAVAWASPRSVPPGLQAGGAQGRWPRWEAFGPSRGLGGRAGHLPGFAEGDNGNPK